MLGKDKRTHWKTIPMDDRNQQNEFLESQRKEPLALDVKLWLYKDYVLWIQPNGISTKEELVLLIKRHVLRRYRDYEKMKREVEILENLENLNDASREPIPETVRIFVWQRDGGKCVKCGKRELLEFDHIIPIAKGGSNTERNIQLLCEPCNRSKGATI
jgi:hypothetical protein